MQPNQQQLSLEGWVAKSEAEQKRLPVDSTPESPGRRIRLTQGKWAIVDPDDFERINKHRWHAHQQKPGLWYAVRSAYISGKWRTVPMHREVLRLSKKDPHVDHKDLNALNNRKSNLRIASRAQNRMNARGWSSSGFKGVHYKLHCPYRPWCSVIGFDRKLIYIGAFASAREAALAYNAKALELFGEFARLNPV